MAQELEAAAALAAMHREDVQFRGGRRFAKKERGGTALLNASKGSGSVSANTTTTTTTGTSTGSEKSSGVDGNNNNGKNDDDGSQVPRDNREVPCGIICGTHMGTPDVSRRGDGHVQQASDLVGVLRTLPAASRHLGLGDYVEELTAQTLGGAEGVGWFLTCLSQCVPTS